MVAWARPSRALGLLLLAPIAAALIGCQSPRPKEGGPQYIDASGVDTRDDIVRIHAIGQEPLWVYDADGRISGVKLMTYFISSETEKGVFVSGEIVGWLYRRVRSPSGALEKELAHTWRLDKSDAMGFRYRKKAIGGYTYGLVLTWPPNVDVQGQQIELVLGYQRGDEKLILAAPRRFAVPITGEAAFPRRGASTTQPAATRAARPPDPT